jgi:adenylyl-sulfate kinase
MIQKKSSHTVWHESQISQNDREALLGQKAVTLWLTGLSASGKSTLAFSLERALMNTGRACYVLDGDNIRHGLSQDLGFSDSDRTENIRRIAEVAKLMNDAGLIVITAFISPLRSDRKKASMIIGEDRYREIYISTSIAICESRDPKGLYEKARAGLVKDFTGVSAPYETPLNPDLVLDTENLSKEESVKILLGIALQS